MPQASESRSKLGSWAGACFVAAVFLFLWLGALMRLHEHRNGEVFLGRYGWLDSLLVLLAPAAMFARFVQLRRQLKDLA